MWPERPNKKSMLHETPAERRATLWELNNVFIVLWSEAPVELASENRKWEKNDFNNHFIF